MLFMVIERFRNHDAAAVYRRFRAQGRMLPDGVQYVNSWVDESLERCFQLMECDNQSLLNEWIARWEDLIEFEVVPVMTSQQAAERINSLL